MEAANPVAATDQCAVTPAEVEIEGACTGEWSIQSLVTSNETYMKKKVPWAEDSQSMGRDIGRSRPRSRSGSITPGPSLHCLTRLRGTCPPPTAPTAPTAPTDSTTAPTAGSSIPRRLISLTDPSATPAITPLLVVVAR
ncbi:hypothetical protein HBI31_230800 [Parastagonospora nodorum]|nr:hypothetical protein HBH81_229840 [Parastagonospora nodorum]KAH4842959.1 hypothetical protein HBH75_210150 [Parastagonospora nodorum]KAH5459074.1 hypothetical protein HBI31_230800 [Parastagonospora nodorum]